MEGRKIEGRARRVEKDSFRALTKVSAGERVTIPLADGTTAEGVVHCVNHGGGFLRVGGTLSSKDGGTFTLSMNASEVGGLVHLPKSGLVHRVDKEPAGEFVIREVLQEDVICSPMPQPRPRQASTPGAERVAEPPPILSSRPQAIAVLYLDFDGEIITNPFWNGGQAINAPAASMGNAQVTAVWQRVVEDFAPFNVDITTNVARYNSAPVDQRMRCIITPNDVVAPGTSGIAFLGAFSDSFGLGHDIPCWVFIDDQVKACADAVSHELGHTLGLQHDGRSTPPEGYYRGHQYPVPWAPIMGVGSDRRTVQWSKGEYAGANNFADDVAIIAGSANGFGYVPDETGDTPTGAVPLPFNVAYVNQAGIITQSTDSDFFVFSTTGGDLNLTVTGGTPSPNLDVVLELQDSSGAILGKSNPASAMDATLSRSLSAGDYFLKVSGTGVGNPSTNGYSRYGSIGAYTIDGFISGGSSSLVPVIATPTAASGLRGFAFTYQILATGSPTSYAVAGALPPGLTFQSDSGLISGTPTKSGRFPLSISATNATGTGSRPITMSINNGAVSIAKATDAPAYAWITDGDNEWAGVVEISFDGVDSVESGPIGDGESTYMETTVTGPGVVRFHWQVDSEAGADILSFAVDGVERAQISGNVAWQLRGATFPASLHRLRWTYSKNATGSQGLDKAWLDTVDVSLLPPPVITSPSAIVGEEGEIFLYQIEADHSPTSFGVTGTLPDGLSLDPVLGMISGIPIGPAMTQVTIEATNDASSTSAPLAITVTPPILTLAESVDAEQFTWYTGGQQDWFPQTLVTSDGLNAAQSGAILGGQTSTLEGIVIGPTALRFRWKVSSEMNGDILEVSVDGLVRAQISGEIDWNERVLAIPSGTRKVRWQYRKDSTVSVGADAGWVDQVTLHSAPQFIGTRQAVGKVGVPFVFRVGAVNTGLSDFDLPIKLDFVRRMPKLIVFALD